jgi:hypothetical protein
MSAMMCPGIATVRVDASGPPLVYRKTYLSAEEEERFWPGPGRT